MHKILAEETCVAGLDLVCVNHVPFCVCISSLTVCTCTPLCFPFLCDSNLILHTFSGHYSQRSMYRLITLT